MPILSAPRFAMALTTAATLVLAGCGFERVPVKTQRPATKIDLAKAGVKTVAVTSDASLTGRDGTATANALADAMSAKLAAAGFEVLDRTALASLLREQQLGQSGMVEAGTAAETGKFTGAKAQIVIHLNSYGMGEGTVTSQQMVRMVVAAGQSPNFTQYTATYPVTIDASFKVLDVKTAKVIAMDKVMISESIKLTAEDQHPGRPDPSATLGKCQEKVVETFINAIVPYTVDEVMLFPTGSKIPGMESGIKQARLGEWSSAIEEFRSAVKTVESDPTAEPSSKAPAHYCLGMALQMTNAFDEAERELKRAYMLQDKDEYKNAYARCQKARADDAKLRAGR